MWPLIEVRLAARQVVLPPTPAEQLATPEGSGSEATGRHRWKAVGWLASAGMLAIPARGARLQGDPITPSDDEVDSRQAAGQLMRDDQSVAAS